ncbi:MAG: hypothetical protein HFE45_05730 [Oscillospiraceae bacterium]|nr:hypothetical protein [Oscillospiraceae bacterium]
MFNILPDEEVCANCRYYHLHYVPGEITPYAPCNCGHCTYPRFKHRYPGQPGCEHFQMKKGLTK